MTVLVGWSMNSDSVIVNFSEKVFDHHGLGFFAVKFTSIKMSVLFRHLRTGITWTLAHIIFSIGSPTSRSVVSHFNFSRALILWSKYWALVNKSKYHNAIGLYRDVWIAAIASSTTSLATRTAAICVRFQGRRVRRVACTSQCRLRSLRENPLWSIDQYTSSRQPHQASTLGLWVQWPGGPVDLKTYWPPKKLTGPGGQ